MALLYHLLAECFKSMTPKEREKIMKFKELLKEGWSIAKSRHLARLRTKEEYKLAKEDPEIICLIAASVRQIKIRQSKGQFGTYLSDERLKELGIKK